MLKFAKKLVLAMLMLMLVLTLGQAAPPEAEAQGILEPHPSGQVQYTNVFIFEEGINEWYDLDVAYQADPNRPGWKTIHGTFREGLWGCSTCSLTRRYGYVRGTIDPKNVMRVALLERSPELDDFELADRLDVEVIGGKLRLDFPPYGGNQKVLQVINPVWNEEATERIQNALLHALK